MLSGGCLSINESDTCDPEPLPNTSNIWSHPNYGSGNTREISGKFEAGESYSELETILETTDNLLPGAVSTSEAIYVPTTGKAPSRSQSVRAVARNGTKWNFDPADSIGVANDHTVLIHSVLATPESVLVPTWFEDRDRDPTGEGTVFALDPEAGTTIWQYEGWTVLDLRFDEAGRVYVLERDNDAVRLTALEHAAGTVCWQKSLTSDGIVDALTAEDIAGDARLGTPAISNGGYFLPVDIPNKKAVDIIRYRTDTGERSKTTSLRGSLWWGIVATNQSLLASIRGSSEHVSKLVAVDHDLDTVYWEHETAGLMTRVATDGTSLCYQDRRGDERLVVRDVATGEKLWTVDDRLSLDPVVVNDNVLSVTKGPVVEIRDFTEGGLEATISLEDVEPQVTLLSTDKQLYLIEHRSSGSSDRIYTLGPP